MTDRETSPEGVIAAYEALLAHSTRMLASAREADWDAVIAQKAHYLGAVERLSHREDGESRDERQRKAVLLERILEQDAEIQRRLVERRDEIERLLGDSRRRLALSRTYGATTTLADARGRFGEEP